MRDNHVKDSLNRVLPLLQANRLNASVLLEEAKGGKKVKKKLSVAFVLVMILAMLTVTALAVITVREVGRQIAENEKKQGYFINWTLEQKRKLISNLIELKYMGNSAEAIKLNDNNLNDQEGNSIANTLIEKFTGIPANEANFLTIMQVPMGSVDTWTYEEKAWYSTLMREVGIDGDGITRFVEPSGKISEQEAIAIARREVAKGYKVQEKELDRYKASVDFEIPEAAEPGDTQAYWHVRFEAPEDMAEDERLFILFPVYVHPETGDLLISVQEMRNMKNNGSRPTNELYQKIEALEAEAGNVPFRKWPLQLKAKYTESIAPLVQKIVKSSDLSMLTLSGGVDIETIARSSYRYGLPGKDDIDEASAFEKAKVAVQEKYGVNDNVFPLYMDYIVYYDITNAEQPLWKYLFNARSLDWRTLKDGLDNPLTTTSYKVQIDTKSGMVISVDEINFNTLDKTLESEMKWY